MNYQTQYDKIVSNAKQCNRVKHKGLYYELHHIIPKCVGGSEEIENKVLLTAKEHFVCHKLLCKIYPNERGIYYAYWMMCTSSNKNKNHKRDYKVSARDYAWLRENRPAHWTTGKKGECPQLGHNGKDNGMFGVKRSRELIEKMVRCRIEANKKRVFNKQIDNIIHPNVKIKKMKSDEDRDDIRLQRIEDRRLVKECKKVKRDEENRKKKESMPKYTMNEKDYNEYVRMRTIEGMNKPEVRQKISERTKESLQIRKNRLAYISI